MFGKDLRLMRPDSLVRGVVPAGNPTTLPPGPGRLPGGRWRPLYADDGTTIAIIFDPHHYANCNGDSLFPLPVIGVEPSVVVLPQSSSPRNFLGLRNSSAAANVYVTFGGNAGPLSWLRLTPNTMVLLDVVVPQDDVYAIADAGSGFLTVTSSTTPGTMG